MIPLFVSLLVTLIAAPAFAAPPVITVLGNNPESVAEGGVYVDAGATAADPEDGDITASIVVSNPVNTNTPGSYAVTYMVTDSNNEVGNASRTVNVIANAPPVVTLLGSNPVQVAQGATYTDAGATANDAEDGNLTGSIITNNPVNTNNPGTYTVTYTVTDSGGKVGNASRTVNVIANTPPTITVSGANPAQVVEGATYVDAGATASDAQDGNLTGSIVTNNPVNTNNPGTYTVTYTVTDSGGLVANATRTVTVASNAAPVITVLGSNPASVNESDTYVDAGATASDAEDGNLTGSIVTNNPVNTNNPGTYTVTYTVTDSGGKVANASRTVNVAANTPPVINGQSALTTAEETALTLRIENFTVTDPDGSPANLVLSVRNGANYARTGNTITPALDFNGNLTVPVVVNDGFSDSPVFNATVSVTAVNDRPRIAGQLPLQLDEDSGGLTITVGRLIIDDPDSTNFTLTLQPGANYTVAGAVVTPAPNFSGQLSVPATVRDDSGAANATSVPSSLTVTVRAINDDPVLSTPIQNQIAVELSPFSLNVRGNFTDVDGDNLTFAASGLPQSGNISINSAGVFSGTPALEDARDDDPYEITVTASDRVAGSTAAVGIFDLVISALDRANVSLSISGAPDPAMRNDQLRWTFNVQNSVGPQGATNVVLNGAFIGDGLTVSSGSGCSVGGAAGQVTAFDCTIGSIPVGGSTSIALDVATSQVGDVTVFAIAEGADIVPIDPNPNDNTGQLAIGISDAFSNGAVQVLGSAGIRSAATGDVNGDGALDLVNGTVAGQPVQIWLSSGFRNFAAAPIVLSDTGANEGVAIADFNEDGNLDLVVANGGGQPDRVYRGDGNGNFTLMATLTSTFANGVAVGDFDNDGNIDIAVAADGGNPIFHGNGNGGFSLQRQLGSADSRDVAVADFNGDGRDDIVFANMGSASRVYSRGVNTVLAQFNNCAATSVAVGQFGGNSRPDLVLGCVPTAIGEVPSNPVLIANNNGSFGNPVARLGTAPTFDVHAGDVNSDGLTDIVVINASGLHQIWNARSGGGFDLHSEQIIANSAIAGVLAEFGFTDVGQPGGVDLAMGGFPQPGLGVYLNDGFGNLGGGDAVAPILTLVGEAIVDVPSGSAYLDAGAIAQDNINGDISGSIVATNTVNTSIVGSYSVTYNVQDFAGNPAVAVSRTVNVTPATGTGGGGGGSLNSWSLLVLGLLIFALSGRRGRSCQVERVL